MEPQGRAGDRSSSPQGRESPKRQQGKKNSAEVKKPRDLDLMRHYTQRRDARNGQRHTLAEDIRMVALEALLPEELERHCQLQRSRLDTYQKLREEVVLYSEA